MRGIESLSSVERSLSRGAPGKWCEVTSQFRLLKGLSTGKSDRDLESVQTLSERRKLHVHLEQNAAFKQKCAAQKRLSEAAAEMDIRNWEQEMLILLFETNRELESQRLELFQANQWADQAQSEK